MKYWPLFLFLYCVCACHSTSGQSYKIDSIKNLLSATEDDSLKSEYYYRLVAYTQNEDVELALDYIQKSIDFASKANAKRLLAAAYNKAGIIYYTLGDNATTLNYFYDVLAIYQQIDDSLQIAKVYNNLGVLLLDLGRVEETVEYYQKSLAIRLSNADSLGMAGLFTNLGVVYYEQDKLDTAHYYFFQALKIDKNFDNATNLLKDYSNIADVYVKEGKYDSADFFYTKAIGFMGVAKDKYAKIEIIEKIANLYKIEKKYDLALEKYITSLAMAEEQQAKLLIRNNYLGLSEVYKEISNYPKSLEFYEKYVDILTELFNEEQAEKLTQIEKNHQIKQREIKIKLLNQESEIKDLKLSNSEMLIYWMAGLVALVIFLIIMQIRKSNYKTKVNNQLRAQNEEIAEKNKDIMDSILCAKNIQQAILPEDERLNEIFKEAFVLNKARDIVSGDFYWISEKKDKIFMAAVDCTGHGVPAAFLNVLANSLLDQIINEYDVTSPAEILKELNSRVLKSLKSNNLSVQVDDGMDMALCVLDKKLNKFSFAGANRPLYYFHNNELQIVKGDHHAVGGELYGPDRTYTDHHLSLATNDAIYLFTDGIVDQFGGELNKKFMYHRFKDLLNEVAQADLSRQKEMILNSLNQWQGSNNQTDDMLLIGVRI